MPRRKRKGKTVKKNQASAEGDADERTKAPHSFVIHRGKTGKYVQDLTDDVRKVMEPYTASNLKVRPKNVVKDFVNVAGVLNVSHMLMFTRTQVGPYLRICRFPRGPTMTFKVDNYTLSRDVRSSLKRQVTYEKQYLNHPLLILNGFSTNNEENGPSNAESEEIKRMSGREISLVASMFQNMFPSINVTTVKVNTIRRCVLINFDSKTQSMEFRHYTIKVVPVGMSKPLKKIVQGKVPNLSRYQDMSEYMTGGGNLSESEAEDDPEVSRVTLPQGVTSRGNMPSEQSSVRLVELGPRITMKLVKIEEGMHDGEVLYHRWVEKTDEEKRQIKIAREKRRKEKEKRKKEQDQNVKKKEIDREEHKQKSLEGMMKKKLQKLKENGDVPAQFQGEEGKDTSESTNNRGSKDDSDEDEEWYRKEVGEEPEKDLFGGEKSRKRQADSSNIDNRFKKRMKKATVKSPASSSKKTSNMGRDQNAKNNASTGKAGNIRKTEAKWKFKGSASKVSKMSSKGKAHSSSRSDFKKDKRKSSKRIFNSEGVGPNYKKGSSAMPKRHNIRKKG